VIEGPPGYFCFEGMRDFGVFFGRKRVELVRFAGYQSRIYDFFFTFLRIKYGIIK
jgi:hypothetical protein